MTTHRNRHDIERTVGETIQKFAEENNLAEDFYGDCYPEEIMQLENRMERMNDEEFEEAIEELKESLKNYL